MTSRHGNVGSALRGKERCWLQTVMFDASPVCVMFDASPVCVCSAYDGVWSPDIYPVKKKLPYVRPNMFLSGQKCLRRELLVELWMPSSPTRSCWLSLYIALEAILIDVS